MTSTLRPRNGEASSLTSDSLLWALNSMVVHLRAGTL
jgi:hypothetical protein